MISLKNISKWYGHFQVLTDCSTEVSKGEVVVVCVPSGSGKSTLIKTVNGLEPIQEGETRVNGISVSDKRTNLAQLRSKVGMVLQHFELFPHLSIIDNLTLAQVKVLKREIKVRRAPKGLPCWNGLAWRRTPTNFRVSCPAASGSAWRLPARCAWIRWQCCSTNSRLRWIRR